MDETSEPDLQIVEMVQAAGRGESAFVVDCLNRGMDVNAKDRGTTSLMMAVRGCHIDLIRILLDRGADLSPENCIEYTAMTYAVIGSRSWGDYIIVPSPDPRPLEMLLAAGGRYELREAALLNDVDLARTRLDEGADPNTGRGSYDGPLLKIAAELGYVEMVDLLLDHGADIESMYDLGQRPLLSAARYGRTDVVLRLLVRGADLDATDWSRQSALSNAAIENHRELAELLLARGAKRNVVDAFAFDDFPLFERLLDQEMKSFGGDADSFHDGRTRLALLAARRGKAAALGLLLDRGAANLYKYEDHSLIAEAARSGHAEIVKLLLERGADPHEVGKDALTPLAWAIRNAHAEVADMLKTAGAER